MINGGQQSKAGPLTGLRVVEFGHVAAAPFAGMLLADLGADVVKVEPLSGDQMRQWPPLATNDAGEAFSHNFGSLNRSKRSVALDLKSEGGLAYAASLVEKADVVIQNYRPGVLERLGLGFEAVTAKHRGLIYCSISGFGASSPHADKGAYDVVVQGMSGMMSVTGEEGGDPVKCGVPVGDFLAGLYAAYSIAALVPQTRTTGESVHLDCPMLDCLIAAAALQTSEYWGTGVVPTARGSAHPRNAPYQAFQAEDGRFTLAAGNDSLWFQVCEATGTVELFDDVRFCTQSARAANQGELVEILAPIFRRESVAHWLAEFERRGVPCGPVHTFAEVLDSDHARSTGLVGSIDMPVIGPNPSIVYPVRFSSGPARNDMPAPRLGEHLDEIAVDWGISVGVGVG